MLQVWRRQVALADSFRQKNAARLEMGTPTPVRIVSNRWTNGSLLLVVARGIAKDRPIALAEQEKAANVSRVLIAE